ncbi:MAG TPA: AAA family ATPase [Methylocystis sp.]|nr:AAA family ATPase [Methylocystis sp.]
MILSTPTLFIFSGAPAAGKTTLARLLAQRLHALYLRLDSMEQPLLAAFGDDIADIGYRAAHGIARDNLRLGHDVVADCVNDVAVTRDAWRDVALGVGVAAVEIEIFCSDPDEHRRRVETRTIDVPGLRAPTWEEICGMKSDPWPRDRLAIDTAGRSVDDCFGELIARLSPLAKRDEN